MSKFPPSLVSGRPMVIFSRFLLVLRLDKIVKEFRERSLLDWEFYSACCIVEESYGLVFGHVCQPTVVYGLL